MKKDGIIHPQLLAVLASLGHTDEILLCDAGYPIPVDVPRIDLGYRRGQPPFLDVLEAIVAELVVEYAVVAAETALELSGRIQDLLRADVRRLPHVELKQRARACKAVIRTGEYTPYANVIIVAGVAF
jgi:D-ribose pyranase